MELQELECIVKERRVRWFEHVSEVDDGRLPKQVTHWEVNTTKRRMGRPRKNCNDTIRQDLKDIGMLWEEAQECCIDREDWRRCVAQCVFDTG